VFHVTRFIVGAEVDEAEVSVMEGHFSKQSMFCNNIVGGLPFSGYASALNGDVQSLVGLSVFVKWRASHHSCLFSEPQRCQTFCNFVALMVGMVQREFVMLGRSGCVLGDDEGDGEQTKHLSWSFESE
jgi:hypothetical protein